MKNVKVLHVTECYAGGVKRAMETRVAATPEVEHHLLWSGDESPESDDPWSSTTALPSGFLARCRAVSKTVARLQPDLIHAHSSWAGVYTRVLRYPIPVVYEPHCYKFDDPTVGVLGELYRLAEKILIRRTATVGVLSAHEEQLTRTLSSSVPTVAIPNVSNMTPVESSEAIINKRIVMVGRLSHQKDPQFFLDVVRLARNRNLIDEAVWVGDGDPNFTDMLTGSDIRVTGWLGSEQLRDEVSNSIYVHTAVYEGFPLSVLDAATLGSPIVARAIPAFDGTGLLQGRTPQEVVDILELLLSDQTTLDLARASNIRLLSSMNEFRLRQALLEFYGISTDLEFE